MFGYVQANSRELKIREYEEYRGYYCGLCHTLKERYGRRGQMLLNYDMTFLLMLLTALYEPENTRSKKRCIPHPIRPHLVITNEAAGYAADMTILLSYQKAVDDGEDEHGASGMRAGTVKALLRRDYAKLAARYPRQVRTLERCMKELAQAEKSGSTDIDYVAGLTGSFLGEIFVWKEDIWQEQLCRTGFFLGKFIYLLDAWDDREKDQKSGAYNLLLKTGASDEAVLIMLQDTMACCCKAFEQLPILETGEILRNILYSGVWVKYAQGETRGRESATQGFV